MIIASNSGFKYRKEWHRGYNEYKHLRLGGAGELYDRAVSEMIEEITRRFNPHLDVLYLEFIGEYSGFKNGVDMEVVVKAAFYLYDKNYSDLPLPLKLLLRCCSLVKNIFSYRSGRPASRCGGRGGGGGGEWVHATEANAK